MEGVWTDEEGQGLAEHKRRIRNGGGGGGGRDYYNKKFNECDRRAQPCSTYLTRIDWNRD